MKKNLSKKLLLNKNTVVSLDTRELNDMRGGYISWRGTCLSDCDDCTHPAYCGVNPTQYC
jgi:natural product precursor